MLHRIRTLRKSAKGARAAGFTIIEVMIVLAIAGVIMAIVFLAIPGFQRSSRNTQRKSDATKLAGLITEYASNNNGRLPTGFKASTSGYLDLTSQTWNILVSPQTASGYTIGVIPSPAPSAPAADTVYVYSGTVCGANSGDTPTTSGATSRNFTIWWGQEGSPSTQCLSQ